MIPQRAILSRLRALWKKGFILTLFSEGNYSQLWSRKMRLGQLLMWIVLYHLLIISIIVTAVVFTPLHIWLSGGDVVDKAEVLELEKKLADIHRQLVQHEQYIEGLKKRWTHQAESAQEVLKKQVPVLPQKRGIAARSKADSLLRQEMEAQLTSQKPRAIPVAVETRSHPVVHFTPPIRGKISAPFMVERDHFGIDIIAPKNTPVLATLPGHVIVADWTATTGYTIGIQHDNNIVSFYKHNSRLLKEIGDFVQAGEAIAIIGNSGILTSGPHLHFELWIDGAPVNPQHYMNFQ